MNNSEKGTLALVDKIGQLENEKEELLGMLQATEDQKKKYWDWFQSKEKKFVETAELLGAKQREAAIGAGAAVLLEKLVKALRKDPRLQNKEVKDLIGTGEHIVELFNIMCENAGK